MSAASILLVLFASASDPQVPARPELIDPFTTPSTAQPSTAAGLVDPFEAGPNTQVPKSTKDESSRGPLLDPFTRPMKARKSAPRTFPGLRDPFR